MGVHNGAAAKELSRKEAAMLRVLLVTGAVLLAAQHATAQTRELDPGQCEQLKQAVAQYGHEAARRHAMEHYGPEAVRAGDKCLGKSGGIRRHTTNPAMR
jgi:hypothetical protein